MSEFDSKALASAREVMAIIRQPHIGGDAQLLAKIQCLFIEAMEYAAPQSFGNSEQLPEPVADVVAWRKEGEERMCDIRWRRFDVAPGPLFTRPLPPGVPDGYCIMPLKLTAANGAKAALSGEFHVNHHIVCGECAGEGCESCNEEGGWEGEILIGWDTIKRIHEAAVEACALPESDNIG